MDKLKNCPWCNGEAILRNIGSYEDDKEIDCWIVICKSQCPATMAWRHSGEPAIIAWNTRIDTSKDKLVAALESSKRGFMDVNFITKGEFISKIIPYIEKEI